MSLRLEDVATEDRNDLRSVLPRDAMEEWLELQEDQRAGETAHSYRRRVRQFVQFLEAEGVMDLSKVTGRTVKDYRDHRRPRLNDQSMRNELGTVRKFLEFGAAMEAVEPALVEVFGHLIPTLSKGEDASEVLLGADRVHAILDYCDRFEYATRDHLIMQLLWDTGCRLSGLLALDVDDVDPEDRTVTFRNRPDSGTRLKNGNKSERMNVIAEETAQVVADYIYHQRVQQTDEYGRDPLLSTAHGRAADTTVRRVTYRLTQPCYYDACPHDRDPATCDWREHGHESKCPSSLSPHPIRTGRITDLRNRGIRIQEVGGRVDAIPETIRRYYDQPSLEQDLDRRRSTFEDTGL